MDKDIIQEYKLNTSEIQLTVNIPKGKTLVSRIENKEVTPYYYRIGNGKKNNLLGKEVIPMNTVQELCNFTSQEQFLFLELEKNLLKEEKTNEKGFPFFIKTNIAKLTNANYSSAEKQKIKTGFKRLRDKNIIKRLKREHYIINPQFLIPYDYSLTKHIWDECKYYRTS